MNNRSRRSTPSMSLNDYLSMTNQYLSMASKRSEDETDFTERDSKIALNAHFREDSDIIEIKSPEYLKRELSKVLQTFMPSYDIPQQASALSTVLVIFSKMIIDVSEQKLSVHCNITQKFDLVKNFIDGNGLTIIATADLPTSSSQGPEEWEITGKGTTTVLQQLVTINLVPKTGYLYVKGSLEIANMTDFYNITGNVSFVSDDMEEAFPRLTSFALTKLKVTTKIASEQLRLIGRCLIFAEPKTPEVVETERRSGIEDESPAALTYESKIRIILENKTNLEYVVGFLGDNIPFTASIENMFNRTVSSASWLKFKRIGVLLSKTTMEENGFNEPVLRNFEIRPGIHIKATVLTPLEEDCRKKKNVVTNPEVGEAAPAEVVEYAEENGGKQQTLDGQDKSDDGSDMKMMENKFCMFLHNNPNLLDYFGTIEGQVKGTTFTFQAERKRKTFLTLFPENGNPIEIRYINFFLQVSFGEIDSVNLAIEGDFKIVFNGNTVIYRGSIKLDDTKGKMTLQLNRPIHIQESPERLPFSIRKLGGGYSVLGETSGEFQKFKVKSQIKVGMVANKMVEFRREPNMIFNVRDPSDLYISGFIKNFENNAARRRNALFEIFEAFGSNVRTHVLLKDIQAEQLTGVVYSARDEDFKIKGMPDTFKKGLNFYGKVKVLSKKRQLFHIHYDSDSDTLTADLHLPYYQATSADGKKRYPLVFKRNNQEDKIEGGKLEVTATTEQTIVKFKGYILAVGAGEQVEVTIESDGQFRLVMPAPSNGEPFNLFKEAPCRYSIQQIDSAASFFAIDPKIIINLDPSKSAIEQALKDHFRKIVQELTKVKTANNFNKYNITVEGEVRTVKELMEATNNQMISLLDSMVPYLDALTVDCVAKCAPKHLTLYGYRWQDSKYVGDDNAHQVADVGCIAECEMIKPTNAIVSEANMRRLSVLRAQYCLLKTRAEIMQQYLDLHYTVLRDLSQLMKGAGRRASEFLNKIDEVAGTDAEIAINLQKMRLSKKLSRIESRGNGSKCIKGFVATFELFGEPARTADLDLCFNGEFAQYTAQAILNAYYGKENITKYYGKMDLAAQRKNQLKMVTERSVELLKKISQSNVDFEKLRKEIVSTAPEPIIATSATVPDADESVNEISQEKKEKKAKEYKKESNNKRRLQEKAFSQDYISYGEKRVSIPILNQRVMKTLSAEPHFSIKNPKAKRIFMYSSPWAAVKILGLHKNESFDGLTQYTAISKAGLNKQQQKDMMYWVRQYENGVKIYSSVADQKLLDHNDNGLKRWKYEMEGSLSRFGLGSFENLLNQFQVTQTKGMARSNIPNKQDATFAQHFQYFSQGMTGLLQNPNLKLENIMDTAKAISDHFEAISNYIPNCT